MYVTVDPRSTGERPINATRRRASAGMTLVYEIPAVLNESRLTARAARLVAALPSTFDDGDDLSPVAKVVRQVSSIEDAGECYAAEYPLRAAEIIKRAASVRKCYGESCDAKTETVEVRLGSAPWPINDHTDYVNTLAERPGLAVALHGRWLTMIADKPVDVGPRPWKFMLTGIE